MVLDIDVTFKASTSIQSAVGLGGQTNHFSEAPRGASTGLFHLSKPCCRAGRPIEQLPALNVETENCVFVKKQFLDYVV